MNIREARKRVDCLINEFLEKNPTWYCHQNLAEHPDLDISLSVDISLRDLRDYGVKCTASSNVDGYRNSGTADTPQEAFIRLRKNTKRRLEVGVLRDFIEERLKHLDEVKL